MSNATPKITPMSWGRITPVSLVDLTPLDSSSLIKEALIPRGQQPFQIGYIHILEKIKSVRSQVMIMSLKSIKAISAQINDDKIKNFFAL